jgi:hypothetical protein
VGQDGILRRIGNPPVSRATVLSWRKSSRRGRLAKVLQGPALRPLIAQQDNAAGTKFSFRAA